MISASRLLRCFGVLAIALLLFVAACELLNLPPEAAFSLVPSAGDAPLAVLLDASSSRDKGGIVVAYSWEFGDGETGSGETATHVYTSPGLYTVNLCVCDNLGGEDTASDGVCVYEPLSASFSAEPLYGKAPLGVDFDAACSFDPSGEDIVFLWDFGDGVTGSGVTTRHTYYSPGVYHVVLTVENESGKTATATQSIAVGGGDNSQPVARIVATPMSGPAPLTVEFDGSASTAPDGSIFSFTWDFGDGDIGAGMFVSHTYIATGTYDPRLTVADDSGRVASSVLTIRVAGQALDQFSKTTFVDSAGKAVSSYQATDSIHVKVQDGSHSGAALITGAVRIGSCTFDISPLAGAPPGTFITRAISPAELWVSGETEITATYTDPTDPADTSSDTITVFGLPQASATAFVNGEGVAVSGYQATDNIYVKVQDGSHSGAALITGAVCIGSCTFDISPLAGAPPGTFITRAISPAELWVSGETEITATYADPTDPSDTSSDTISVSGN